ncbi:hypothetical protein VCHC41A1_3088, partial [Vibrio cholerae HC-41A1]
MKLNLK